MSPGPVNLLEAVAERTITGAPSGRHARPHLHARIAIADHEDIALDVLLTVETVDVLSQRPLPTNWHGQKQRVEARIAETFAEMAPGCQDQPLLIVGSAHGLLCRSAADMTPRGIARFFTNTEKRFRKQSR